MNTIHNNLQTATFAGGCFWCTEAIFKRLKGVYDVVSGYTGGTMDKPSYDAVSRGSTGHTEAVQITFDPEVISYAKLLDIFWHLHDPTTLNRQGNDIGSQYRSVIFYHTDEQKQIAEKSKQHMENSRVYNSKIVTDIKPFTSFFKAEEYHQNYYDRNQEYPYCTFIINPKIKKLLEKYNQEVKEEYK